MLWFKKYFCQKVWCFYTKTARFRKKYYNIGFEEKQNIFVAKNWPKYLVHTLHRYVKANCEIFSSVANITLSRFQFRRELRDDTAKKCVYPNRLIIPMSGSVDPMQIKCFEPTGLVAVKVLSAAGLAKKKGIRTIVGQVPMLLFLKYFRRKMWRKNERFFA
jgi:hypothetical protein